MSRFPFPRYPDGWFQVAYSSELPPGGVMPLKYFGKDLVLFRPAEEGAAPSPSGRKRTRSLPKYLSGITPPGGSSEA